MRGLPCKIPHLIQHILNKDPVPRCRIVDQHVRDRADELAVLNNGLAAHKCGQEGTTKFVIFSTAFTAFFHFFIQTIFGKELPFFVRGVL